MRVDEGLLAADYLGDQPPGDRSERQAVVRVTEREPEIAIARRGTDDRHHVRRAGTRAHPGVGIETLAEREELARDRLGAVELHRRLHAVAQRELGAG